jgi:DNA polymerase elongation subunit (family B)
LPIEFTEYVLELYANKTELKDVAGMEDLYMQSKQYINSMFGMCVTAIVQADVELYGDEWLVKNLTREVVEHRLEKLRSFNPREKRYFLSYSWGCWITAYARRNLWKCIEKHDREVIYCDTDSIFVRGRCDYEWYNNEITEK